MGTANSCGVGTNHLGTWIIKEIYASLEIMKSAAITFANDWMSLSPLNVTTSFSKCLLIIGDTHLSSASGYGLSKSKLSSVSMLKYSKVSEKHSCCGSKNNLTIHSFDHRCY